MNDSTLSIAALLHSDGTLPTGGFGFSSGLEALFHDEQIDVSDPFRDLLLWYAESRWAGFDRYYLCRSLEADTTHRHVLDREVEMSIFSEASRSASTRAGRAFLSAWARAGNEAAVAYKTDVSEGRAMGHLPVVQGLVYGADGLDRHAASRVSLWALVSNLCSVAVRLGAVGAVSAQTALRSMVPVMAALVDKPLPHVAESWTPLQDIAMERHCTQSVRLFAS